MNQPVTDPAISSTRDRATEAGREFGVQALLDELADPSRSPSPAIAAGFDGLLRLAESLPLTTDEFGFAFNWITSARQLWERGEPGAARYQVDLVRKKLNL